MEENLDKSKSQKKKSSQEPQKPKVVFDDNPDITDGERLPIHAPLKLIRYRTLKKNIALGWWSAVVLLEDHKQKQVCFYRWKRRGGEWKRDKKLPFRAYTDWQTFRNAIESFWDSLK